MAVNVDMIVIYFFIYSVVGWIVEVSYCGVLNKHLTNRGFLKGPYLPIYGFGGMAIAYAIKPLLANTAAPSNPLSVFIGAALICSFIEYLGSWILEKAFKVKLWDYKNYKINLNGRVCLVNSVLFGLLGLFVVYILHPFIVDSVGKLDKISAIAIFYTSRAIEIVMTFDLALSITRMKAFTRALDDIRIKSDELETKIVALSANSSKSMAEARARLESEIAKQRAELESQKAAFAARSYKIFIAYPTMKLKNHEATLRFELFKMQMRSFIDRGMEERKKRSEKLNLAIENRKARLKNMNK
ncbi:MAG: putative ABC transporter permease [Sphaerochaeta sp.]